MRLLANIKLPSESQPGRLILSIPASPAAVVTWLTMPLCHWAVYSTVPVQRHVRVFLLRPANGFFIGIKLRMRVEVGSRCDRTSRFCRVNGYNTTLHHTGTASFVDWEDPTAFVWANTNISIVCVWIEVQYWVKHRFRSPSMYALYRNAKPAACTHTCRYQREAQGKLYTRYTYLSFSSPNRIVFREAPAAHSRESNAFEESICLRNPIAATPQVCFYPLHVLYVTTSLQTLPMRHWTRLTC